MGKVDDMRAMREAKYAAAPGSRTPPKIGASIPVPSKLVGGTCPKVSISGKRCIREKDHPEKNHKYAKD